MSLPIGSKIINNISTTTFNYLTGSDNNDFLISSWDSNQWNYKGKPKYNIEQTIIFEDLLVDLNKALPERNTVNTTIFEDYPNLSSSSNVGDIEISNVLTEIYVTFIDEGAGYKNTLGYYFYIIDSNGDKQMLGNADDNDGSINYYNPTIIFPNASRQNGGFLKSGGNLIPGMKRKLRGNVNNKFINIKVGFFLLPNGWENSSVGVQYDNKNIIHSTNEFNANYNTASAGIQTILFKNNDDYLLCFEDIQRPSGDSDFNDLIIKINTDVALTNTTNIITLTNQVIPSDIFRYDYYGSFINVPLSNFDTNNVNKSYCFKRTLNLGNKNKRDKYLDILNYIVHNLDYEITVLNDNVIKIKYCFDNNKVLSNIHDNKLRLYILKKEDNIDDETIVDGVETIYDKLVSYQHLENEMVSQDIEVTNIENDVETVTVNETGITPLNTTGDLMVWGDPYISLLDGNKMQLPNENRIYKYLEMNDLKINISCELFENNPIEEYRKTSFIRFIKFYYKDNVFTIDMFNNLDLYDENNKCVPNNEFVSLINQVNYNKPKLLHLQSKYMGLIVREININGLIIWCIIYPHYFEYYNEIYIDKVNNNILFNVNGLIVNGEQEKNILEQL